MASGFGQQAPGAGGGSEGPPRAQGGPDGASVGVCARSAVPRGGARDPTEYRKPSRCPGASLLLPSSLSTLGTCNIRSKNTAKRTKKDVAVPLRERAPTGTGDTENQSSAPEPLDFPACGRATHLLRKRGPVDS